MMQMFALFAEVGPSAKIRTLFSQHRDGAKIKTTKIYYRGDTGKLPSRYTVIMYIVHVHVFVRHNN